MGDQPDETLIDAVRKLRETGEALIERVEDVAVSIRYMTNNLLDDAYHPEMASSLRELASSVSELTSLSPNTTEEQAGPAMARRMGEMASQIESVVRSTGKNASEEEGRMAAVPQSVPSANGSVPIASRQRTLFMSGDRVGRDDPTPSPAKPAVAESQESQAEGMDSFASHHTPQNHRPYTIDDLQSFQERFENQQITAAELKAEFHQLLDSRKAIIETLVQENNAKQLKADALR